MTRTYSVLQYMPDLRRKETVNLGVVIFDSSTSVRVVADLALIRSRLRCFAPTVPERALAGWIEHLRTLKTADLVRTFIRSNTNIIATDELWLSPHQPIDACESSLWRLLVKSPPRVGLYRGRPTLRRALDIALRELDEDSALFKHRNIGPIQRPDLFGIHDPRKVTALEIDPFDLVLPNSGRVIGAKAFLASASTKISDFSDRRSDLKAVRSVMSHLAGDKFFLPSALIVPDPDQARVLDSEARQIIRKTLSEEITSEYIYDLADRDDRRRLVSTAKEFAHVH